MNPRVVFLRGFSKFPIRADGFGIQKAWRGDFGMRAFDIGKSPSDSAIAGKKR